MPVNLPTHGHGQGYADVKFLIPGLVQPVGIRKVHTSQLSAIRYACAVSIDAINSLPTTIAEMTLAILGVAAAGSTEAGGGALIAGQE
ncbi:hypothetical protein GPL17_27735 [Bradyrhizobium yuanmingense]|uniref:hypothetical protein n=1 Tax=Bradyrhizobium TaxID=374 RepID=UPI000FE543B1|nr:MULTISPECIES: hypothetical protein [Bradyrhizobium]MDF0492674.1 hypothetical protein [Bradyrhizobium yuanmingense]MDF0515834.1 hypothetical protein [Bradyrhizobium yuanmingense]MVT54252.1 hypothetical protein [Bradyrhizobium yuanmingense]TGN86795.1 hypothetical protein EOW77_0015970 [Bradyrhizobium yuanmingense]UWU70629.1 hypothetical protein N2602_08920 [Bradyrhizobium sp. NC92]